MTTTQETTLPTPDQRMDWMAQALVMKMTADQKKIADGYFSRPVLTRIFSPIAGRANRQRTHFKYESPILFINVDDTCGQSYQNALKRAAEAQPQIEEKMRTQLTAAGFSGVRIDFETTRLGPTSISLPTEETVRLTAHITAPLPAKPGAARGPWDAHR